MLKLMPKSLEETVMFRGEEFETFEDLYDRLVSHTSTRQSMRLDVGRGPNTSSSSSRQDPNAMDIQSSKHH